MKRSFQTAAILLFTIGATTVLAWRDDRESFRTTWESVAEGVESPPATGMIAIWDGEGRAMRTTSALPLRLAAFGGAGAAPLTYASFLALLIAVWMLGVRQISQSLGATDLTSDLVGAATAFTVAAVADGRIAVLGTAPAIWLVGAIVADRPVTRRSFAWLSLALLSRSALALSIPLGVLAGLLRAERRSFLAWVPLGIGVFLYVCSPEPDWVRALRTHDPYHLAHGTGDVALLGVFDHETVLRTVAAGAGAALLWVGAAAGASRASGSAAYFITAVALAVLVAPVPAGYRSLFATLATLFAEFKTHEVGPIASAVGIAVLAALGSRAPSLALPALGLIAIAAVPSWRSPSSPAISPQLAAAASNETGHILALPMSPANDHRWRRALPAHGALENGLQRLLTRNAAVLADELDPRDPRGFSRIAGRLGVEAVVLPADLAPLVGDVVAEADGESLVRVRPPVETSRPPCRSPEKWRVSSSSRATDVGSALDGNLATRWGTGEAQRPGQWFAIELGEATALQEVELRFGGFTSDRPRGLAVEVRTGDAEWRTIWSRDPWLGRLRWRGATAYESVDRVDRLRVPLAGIRADAIRFTQTRKTRIHDWSIAEVCLR